MIFLWSFYRHEPDLRQDMGSVCMYMLNPSLKLDNVLIVFDASHSDTAAGKVRETAAS